jgi:hypothetical protein
MRLGLLILFTCLAAPGCASKSGPQALANAPLAQASDDYDHAIAASLVFEPPIVASQPKFEFSRAGRAPEAYAGFEEIISTYYYLRVDDRQLDYNGQSHDRFERRAITTRVGVVHR